VSNSGDIDYSYDEERFVSANIPGWKKALREGSNATTSMAGSRINITYSPGNIYASQAYVRPPNYIPSPGDFIQYSAQLSGLLATPYEGPGYPGLTQVSYTSALNQALSRAIQKINSAQTSFQGGVFLGELRETVHMITRPGKALYTGVWDYLTVAKKRLKKVPERARHRVLSNTWLEYSFGWKPLVADIDDGIDALGDLLENPGSGLTAFRGTGTSEWVSDIGQKFISDPLGIVEASYRIRRREKVDIRIYGAMRQSSLAKTSTMQRLGLGFNNFVPTVWELIPYSFLADYFANIGDIVTAASTCTDSLAWINIGTKITVSEETYDSHLRVDPGGDPSTFSQSGGGSPGSFKWESVRINRGPYLGSLVPSLEFKIPGVDSLKWLNVAALLSRHQSLIHL